jgi:hypothetical protein
VEPFCVHARRCRLAQDGLRWHHPLRQHHHLHLAADYAILRWLKLGVDWSGSERTSNTAGGGFKGNVTMFTLNASL